MKKDFEKTTVPADTGPAPRPPATAQPTVLVDVEYYQAIIDDPEISDAYKRELIAIIGAIVVHFIDIGCGVHPVQQALQDQAAQDNDPPPTTQSEKETHPERSDA